MVNVHNALRSNSHRRLQIIHIKVIHVSYLDLNALQIHCGVRIRDILRIRTMNNCHLGILEIYQVDIRNIHYPWYIDGIREIYAKIYASVY